MAKVASYKMTAAYSLPNTGLVFLRAEAMKGGTEVARSLTYTVWSQPAAEPVAPEIDIYPLSEESDPVKRFSFSGEGFAGSTISLQRLVAGLGRP